MESRKKIFVVEDDRAIAIGLKALLEAENYAVTLVHDGKEGLKKALSSIPDLILLDVNLPYIGGYEICRELRSKGFINPIIMLTSQSEQIDKVIGLEAGADDYVTKPFDSRELLARVRAHQRQKERILEIPQQLPHTAAKGSHQHKLLSIMFTDMKDYSKKMNENEEMGIVLLNRHNKMMNQCIDQYDGKVVEIIGDAFLVSFDSAVRAVKCAITIQKNFKAYNKSQPRREHIGVRIGIHLGDVIEMDGRLKGDTINIAARIQQIATAGKVFLSESVAQAIQNKTNIKIVSVGAQQFKNISQAIRVYHIHV